MKLHKKKLLTTVSAVALVLAVGACSSSSDDDGPMAGAPPPPPPEEMPPAPESDVTQVGEDEATAVTTVRDSDGDLKGIKVGETEISTIRFAQNQGKVETEEKRDTTAAGKPVAVGILAANAGYMIQHVESYATTSTAMRIKRIGGAPEAGPILDISDLDVDDLGAMPLNTPEKTDGSTPSLMPVAAVEYEKDGETATLPMELTGLSPSPIVVSMGADDKIMYYLKVGAVVADIENGDPVALGSVEVSNTDLALGTELFVGLPAVMVKDGSNLDRDKAMGFDYLAYGAWAKIDDKDMPTELGNGYLIAYPSMLTSADSMPVTGKALFEGQYVSYVRKMGTGTIEAMDGDATMEANFGKDAMSVTLVDQFGAGANLILTGTIDGNTFAGTGLGAKSEGGSYLDVDGAISEMSGGFYGEKVDEAGGVYDVLGGSDKKAGRVVGAFGGVNTGN